MAYKDKASFYKANPKANKKKFKKNKIECKNRNCSYGIVNSVPYEEIDGEYSRATFKKCGEKRGGNIWDYARGFDYYCKQHFKKYKTKNLSREKLGKVIKLINYETEQALLKEGKASIGILGRIEQKFYSFDREVNPKVSIPIDHWGTVELWKRVPEAHRDRVFVRYDGTGKYYIRVILNNRIIKSIKHYYIDIPTHKRKRYAKQINTTDNIWQKDINRLVQSLTEYYATQ